MKWVYREPVPGDMIRVSLGGIYHFGIYVSDDEVIQFGLPPTQRVGVRDADVEVMSSDIDTFLAGGFLEVCDFDRKEKKNNRKPSEIVSYARSKLGTRGYSILYNNCEHFANECVSGVHICRQAEDLRAMFRKIPVVDVYIATIPENASIGMLESEERMREIDSVSNEKVKLEKFYVWKLLEYALERSFGMRKNKQNFTKENWGGWSVEGAEISLSHSDGVLAVAVSRSSVGVDIERVRVPSAERFAESIMNESERSLFADVSKEDKEERLIEIWTAKEAIFKSKKESVFSPKNVDTLSGGYKTDGVEIGDKKLVWSVATSTPEIVRVFTKIDLSEV